MSIVMLPSITGKGFDMLRFGLALGALLMAAAPASAASWANVNYACSSSSARQDLTDARRAGNSALFAQVLNRAIANGDCRLRSASRAKPRRKVYARGYDIVPDRYINGNRFPPYGLFQPKR